MVELHNDEPCRLLILKPNSSMSWETNKKILIAMFAVNMVVGICFAMIGAWLILPFAGLEVLMVGAGMYYVYWKLNFTETIRVEAESLIVQKGVYYPKQTWRWQKSHTRLVRLPSKYRLSPPQLYLQHLNERIEIGDFLNREDKTRLWKSIVELGIPITTIARR